MSATLLGCTHAYAGQTFKRVVWRRKFKRTRRPKTTYDAAYGKSWCHQLSIIRGRRRS